MKLEVLKRWKLIEPDFSLLGKSSITPSKIVFLTFDKRLILDVSFFYPKNDG